MTRDHIAYVVPTKDRPVDLKKLLESLAGQTSQPSQIVIVDGGDVPVDELVGQFPALPVTYVREYPPSLARQRNAGMAALRDDITIAGYLDDDVVLAPDATQQMSKFWASAAAEVGGASFTIVNQPRRNKLFGRLSDFFLINGSVQGRVLKSGFATSITPHPANLRTEWLYGGATLWRRRVVTEYQYDEWYLGHGYLEDLDFSYRVSRTYQLWVVARARLWHYPHPIRVDRNVSLGRQQVVNRVYFANKHPEFRKLALSWALFGQCVRNGLESLLRFERGGILRLWGNLIGMWDLVKRPKTSVEGIWK